MISPRRRPAASAALLLIALALAARAGIAHSARVPERGAAIVAADVDAARDGAAATAAAAASSSSSSQQQADTLRRRHRKKRHRKAKNPYSSPLGLFIQERASKMLPGPGQHFSFGALKPWEDVTALLEEKPASERKLLLLIRHGQAVSNFLGDALGPDEWFRVEGTCRYDPKNGTDPLDVFDADLTALGRDQASALNSMLRGGGWWPRLTGGYPVRAVVSPLTRCLNTATLALDGLSRVAGGIRATVVEEFVRETLGEDTCDARRSASDPEPDEETAAEANFSSSSAAAAAASSSSSLSSSAKGPCAFDKGLRTLFPSYTFEVHDEGNRNHNRTRAASRVGRRGDDEDEDDDDDDPDPSTPRPFGLVSDADTLWTKDAREQQKHQVKRARAFLDILFAHSDERVAVVVTHSGFARSLLLAVEREPYRPMNAELVPVIVDRQADDDEDDGEEDEEVALEEEGRGGASGGEPAAARR